MQRTLATAIFLIILLLLNYNPAFAGGPCGCYCGIYLPAPCSDDACKRACGWQDPSAGRSAPPSYDDSAEYQRQEDERRRREEVEKQRQIELKKLLKREEADAKLRQERFERDKQEALKSIKGIAGSDDLGIKDIVDIGTGALGLKGIGDTATPADSIAKHANRDKPPTVGAGEFKDAGTVKPNTATGIKKSLTPLAKAQVEEIARGLRTAEVPPAVSTDQLSIRLRLKDRKSERILLGTEVGVAVADITALRIAGQGFTVWPKLILATGRTVIAMEGGADVYLVKQDEVYEQALRWLKDKNTSRTFSEAVQALREHKPLRRGISAEMARTAKAIIDPNLGNSGKRIAWGAMGSREAYVAGLRRACAELGAGLIGKGVEGYAQKYLAAREPLFQETLAQIRFAEKGRKEATDPAMKKAWEKVIKEAGGVMGRTYRSYAKGTGEGVSITTKVVYENALETIDDMEKRNR
jgi:hypothetical protein